jgi:dTDP-4-dehydrorhamnose reductase
LCAYNDYGISKYLGEQLLYTTIIRSSIIGEHKTDKSSLIEWIKSNSNKSVNGYTNHLWNGITCLEYAKLIKEIIDNNFFWYGVKNIVSTFNSNLFISKYELIILISNIFKLNITINPINDTHNCNRILHFETNFKHDFINIIRKDIQSQLYELYDFSQYITTPYDRTEGTTPYDHIEGTITNGNNQQKIH